MAENLVGESVECSDRQWKILPVRTLKEVFNRWAEDQSLDELTRKCCSGDVAPRHHKCGEWFTGNNKLTAKNPSLSCLLENFLQSAQQPPLGFALGTEASQNSIDNATTNLKAKTSFTSELVSELNDEIEDGFIFAPPRYHNSGILYLWLKGKGGFLISDPPAWFDWHVRSENNFVVDKSCENGTANNLSESSYQIDRD